MYYDYGNTILFLFVCIYLKKVLAYTRMNGNYLTFYNNIP